VLAFGLASMGVAIASRMSSQQAFMIIINFLTMPIFFLSGALFPLQGLPWWMDILTHINPASYGVDPLRRVVLGQGGFPGQAVDALSLTLGGQVLPMVLEAAVVIAFGIVMLGIAVLNFRRRD
jgi:ABC-2 type transport system permease protein